MRNLVVFVASLGHSGSTLIDLLLGAHPRIAGLGEVCETLERFRQPQNDCTCGRGADDCPVWGPVFARLRASDGLPFPEAYAAVMQAAGDVYGPERILVDSSKHRRHLERAHSTWTDRFKVLFLVRDVRGFVASTARRPAPAGLGLRRRLVRGSATLLALEWYRRNRAYERFLAEHSVEHVRLGYEELCLRTDDALVALTEFLGIEPFPPRHSLPSSESHILRGNRMRFDPVLSKRISYDHRWFHDRRVQLAVSLLPGVHEWNRRAVYGNLEDVDRTGGS